MKFNSVNLDSVKTTQYNPLQSPEDFLPLVVQITIISRSERWMVSRRLSELDITSRCPSDGSLWVEVNNSLQAILIRTVVQHMLATRGEQIDWLDRCWDSSFTHNP